MAAHGESLLPYYTAQSGSGVGMFNTAMGKLQRQLYKGEYDIFKYAPIFESDFIQITKRGEVIDVHNRVRMVTVGIACTSPILPLPDVMLLARPAAGCDESAGYGQATKGRSRKGAKPLELTRLLPLKFVRISVHNREKQQLHLKFATGRSCYLQLCPALEARDDLFAYWEKVIYLLRPPVDSNSSTYAIPAEDMLCMPVFEEEEKTSLAAADFQGKGDQDQVSIRSLRMATDVSGATSAAYAGGEGIQPDSRKSPTGPDVATPKPKSKELAKESATGTSIAVSGAAATGRIAGTLSMAATKSAGSRQVNMAVAAGAAVGPRGSRSQQAIAGTAQISPKSIHTTLAGAASRSSKYIGSTSTSLSPEDSLSVATAQIEQAAGDPSADPAAEPLASTLPGRQQRVAQAGAKAHKERRERRERKEMDRALGRSAHCHRTGKGHRKVEGDKSARKPSGHRATKDDKKEKGQGSPAGSRHSSSHKGVSHIPIAKESRISHKSGRSLSTTSMGSTSKRLGRLSSFLRTLRVGLTAKGASVLHSQDVDIVAKTVETNVDAIMETVESGQGLEIVGSVTSEVMETVAFEAH